MHIGPQPAHEVPSNCPSGVPTKDVLPIWNPLTGCFKPKPLHLPRFTPRCAQERIGFSGTPSDLMPRRNVFCTVQTPRHVLVPCGCLVVRQGWDFWVVLQFSFVLLRLVFCFLFSSTHFPNHDSCKAFSKSGAVSEQS